MVQRQGRANLPNTEAFPGKKYDLRALYHPMLRASPPYERLKPSPSLVVELNLILRYPFPHPSVSRGFVESQLDSTCKRTGTSNYFHDSSLTITTSGTLH